MTEILTKLIEQHQYKMKIKTKDLIRKNDKKPPELMLSAKNPNSWNGHTYVFRFEYRYAFI